MITILQIRFCNKPWVIHNACVLKMVWIFLLPIYTVHTQLVDGKQFPFNDHNLYCQFFYIFLLNIKPIDLTCQFFHAFLVMMKINIPCIGCHRISFVKSAFLRIFLLCCQKNLKSIVLCCHYHNFNPILSIIFSYMIVYIYVLF